MAYIMRSMEFIETPTFTRLLMELFYPKSKKDMLTDRETALLRDFVKVL